MLVKNTKPFLMGIALAVSFLIVLALIFSPLFDGMNGLEYSDHLFNKLAKGSSYFIGDLEKSNEDFKGKAFSLTIDVIKPELVDKAVKVLGSAGVQVNKDNTRLTMKGDLGVMLAKVLNDSDAMYKNDGQKITKIYGFDERDVMEAWHVVLKGMTKVFQKEAKAELLEITERVIRKGIEPAFNFYKIEGQKVSDKAFTLIGLLLFYILYTMWWGYAIFMMFDGLGLSMKKAKVKKEV